MYTNFSKALTIYNLSLLYKWKGLRLLFPNVFSRGSHFGPLLFNLFINDITTCFLDTKAPLFADNLKCFKFITVYDDTRNLQSDVNRLASRCSCNDMDLNISKCHIIRFRRNHHLITFNYSLFDHVLNPVNQIKDLGMRPNEREIQRRQNPRGPGSEVAQEL